MKYKAGDLFNKRKRDHSMKYLSTTIDEFSKFVIDNDMNIILFGYGAVCKTFIPYIANNRGFSNKIKYIIDNNPAKRGKYFLFDENKVPVVDSSIFERIPKNYCLLITNGDFYSVIEQLKHIKCCEEMPCFISAYMQLDRKYDRNENHIYMDYDRPRIPKIIHYCWFSENKIPNNLLKCIDTWKEICYDYEFICWNEKNYDVKRNRYTREAYEMEKWGYIPDVVRLEKLYECGGFYFDTDVKILKSLEPLRYEEAFCGRERAGHVNFGGGSGCVKGCDIIKKILDFRIDEPFNLGNGNFNGEASGYYESAPLMQMGLVIEDVNQKLDGLNVYASEFFSPYNYINGENIQNENTFSIHFFSGSWIEGGNIFREQTREKYVKFRTQMEKI